MSVQLRGAVALEPASVREDDPLGVECHEPARGLARCSGAALNDEP
jgi:hypothetical protein